MARIQRVELLAAGTVSRIDKVSGYLTSSREELKVVPAETDKNDKQRDLVLRRELDEMSCQVAQGHDGHDGWGLSSASSS